VQVYRSSCTVLIGEGIIRFGSNSKGPPTKYCSEDASKTGKDQREKKELSVARRDVEAAPQGQIGLVVLLKLGGCGS